MKLGGYMADEPKKRESKTEQPEKEHIMPWPTAEGAIKDLRGETETREVKSGAQTLASVTTEKASNRNPIVVRLADDTAPVMVTAGGVHVGKKEIKPGEAPDGAFLDPRD